MTACISSTNLCESNNSGKYFPKMPLSFDSSTYLQRFSSILNYNETLEAFPEFGKCVCLVTSNDDLDK